jgi:hypothetical protein
VTATVTDAYNNPNPSTAAVFTVSGPNSAGPSTQQTDSSGQAQFCYTGTHAGGDTVSAFADVNSNTVKDTGEPSDTASVTFVNYARPRGATPFRVALVPAYRQCSAGSANSTHGAPLANPSCKPPTQASNFLTVGTGDANGATANMIGSVLMVVKSDSTDVRIQMSTTDVRCKTPSATTCPRTNSVAGNDYGGELRVSTGLRLTDLVNGPSPNVQGTVTDTSYSFTVPCATTLATNVGSTCSLSTTVNAITPGAIAPGNRAIWELGQVNVYDGGSTGSANAPDATLFATQGIFVP